MRGCAGPRSQPPCGLSAAWLMCCLPGGDIFNDFSDRALGCPPDHGDQQHSLKAGDSPCPCHLYFNLYTPAQDLTPYDL